MGQLSRYFFRCPGVNLSMGYGSKRKYEGPLQPGKRSAYVRGGKRQRGAQAPYTQRVPVTTRRATRINKAKIKSLESKVNGQIQRGYDILQLRQTPATWQWTTGAPLLLCMNDMYTKNEETGLADVGPGAAYYPTYTPTGPGGGPPFTTEPKIIARWQSYQPGFGQQLTPEYHMWKDVATATCSLDGYQPIYTDIRFCVKRTTVTPAQGDLWVRLDQFHARKFFIPQSQSADSKVYSMPQALGSLQNMAVQDVGYLRNSFNPAIWATKTRWIRLRAPAQAMNELTHVFHVRCKFPKKFLKLNMNVDTSVTPNQGEEFWTMVDPKTPKWLLVSISNNPAAGNTQTELSVTRRTVWRDQKGNSM